MQCNNSQTDYSVNQRTASTFVQKQQENISPLRNESPTTFEKTQLVAEPLNTQNNQNQTSRSRVQGKTEAFPPPNDSKDHEWAKSNNPITTVRKFLNDLKNGSAIFIRTTLKYAKGEEKTSISSFWSKTENFGFSAGKRVGLELHNLASKALAPAKFVGIIEKKQMSKNEASIKVHKENIKELKVKLKETENNKTNDPGKAKSIKMEIAKNILSIKKLENGKIYDKNTLQIHDQIHKKQIESLDIKNLDSEKKSKLIEIKHKQWSLEFDLKRMNTDLEKLEKKQKKEPTNKTKNEIEEKKLEISKQEKNIEKKKSEIEFIKKEMEEIESANAEKLNTLKEEINTLKHQAAKQTANTIDGFNEILDLIEGQSTLDMDDYTKNCVKQLIDNEISKQTYFNLKVLNEDVRKIEANLESFQEMSIKDKSVGMKSALVQLKEIQENVTDEIEKKAIKMRISVLKRQKERIDIFEPGKKK